MCAFTVARLRGSDPSKAFDTYSSALGAAKALKAAGVSTLPEWLDREGYQRIAPAAALPADILAFEDDDGAAGLGTLGMALGQSRALLFARLTPEGEASCVGIDLRPGLYRPVAAWRTF